MGIVTVIIPAFNAERYIGDALGSVREQTLRDVEVVLVDDGSTDGTLQRARQFTDSLDLTIVRQSNRGPSAARNAGIRRARGRYCAFLDADDIMLPDCLAAQTALFEANPDFGLVLSDVGTFDERGTIRSLRWNFTDRGGRPMLERLLLENFVTTSAVMAPRQCLIDAGLFPESRRVAEDYELWLRMFARWEVGVIDRPLVRYRYVAGSLSDDRLFSAQCALDVIQLFWDEHPEYGRSRPRLRRRSLAKHLTNAGIAALAQGERGLALAYMLGALRRDLGVSPAWRGLAKTLLHSGWITTGNRPLS